MVVLGIAPGVQDLQQDAPAAVMHGAGDVRQVLRFFAGRENGRAGFDSSRLVGGEAAGDDQRHAAAGALAVERRLTPEMVVQVLESGVHRSHDHAVLQQVRADLYRRQQGRVGGEFRNGRHE